MFPNFVQTKAGEAVFTDEICLNSPNIALTSLQPHQYISRTSNGLLGQSSLKFQAAGKLSPKAHAKHSETISSPHDNQNTPKSLPFPLFHVFLVQSPEIEAGIIHASNIVSSTRNLQMFPSHVHGAISPGRGEANS